MKEAVFCKNLHLNLSHMLLDESSIFQAEFKAIQIAPDLALNIQILGKTINI